MMKVLRWIWAGLRGLLIALGASTLLTLILVSTVLVQILTSGPSRPEATTPLILTLKLQGTVKENPAVSDPLALLQGGGSGMTLHQMISAVRRATRDEQVRGLWLEISDPDLGLSQMAELQAALAAFRAAGKRIVAYADGYGSVIGGGNRPYLMALAADEIIVNPVGIVAPTGVSGNLYFLRDALEQAGLGADVFRFREAKTAFNWIDQTGITPAQQVELAKQVAVLDEVLISTVSQGRDLSREDALALIKGAPYTGEQALAAGLVDRLDAGRDIEGAFADLEKPETMALRAYAGLGDHPPAEDGPVIAVVFMEGSIGGGGPDEESALSSPVIFGNPYAKLLTRLAKDEEIAAIIVRINSGGGSPIGSEIIRAALAAIEDKPVVVSMGAVAASGGYWIALGGDHLFAHPHSWTGSIGVTAALPNVAGLSNRLGVRWDQVTGETTAPGQWHYSTGLDTIGQQRMQRLLEASYQQFLARVSEARGLSVEAVEAVAQGQIWSGEQALERGLVDELGDLRAAIRHTRTLLELQPDARTLVRAYPNQPSPIQQLQGLLATGLAGAHALSELAPLATQVSETWARLRPLSNGGVQAVADTPMSLR